MEENTVDTSKSKFKIEGDEALQKIWRERTVTWRNDLLGERAKRKTLYRKRRDFFEGDQNKYTNIKGLHDKERKGQPVGVYNLAGAMIRKIGYAIGNNPPGVTYKPLIENNVEEDRKTQALENFWGRVIWTNKFWKGAYKRAANNQTLLADFALFIYPDFDKEIIKIVNLEKMENLMVGWRSDDPTEYDYVIYEEDRSTYSIEKEFGVIAQPTKVSENVDPTYSGHDDPYDTRGGSRQDHHAASPDGKTKTPMARVTNLWTDEVNVVLINDKMVQFTYHEFGFNPIKIGRNIHNPGQVWSKSDIDDLIDPQIEYNEAQNDVRAFIRTGVNQKFRAHNMPDFDPESLKTGSGQVIYTEDDETFDPIPVNVNTFPADQYITRVERMMHKLGVPEVALGAGAGAGASGRSRAIDFQSFVDIVINKQQQWELVLEEVSEAVQILGNKYFAPKKGVNFFTGPDGQFEVREIRFDWTDILPITQSDKQVDVINKKNARMISLRTALSEMGYADPDTEISRIKTEWKDKELAPVLANQTSTVDGVVQSMIDAEMKKRDAMQDAQQEEQADAQKAAQDQNAASPAMLQGQNQETVQPMSQPGTQASFTSPQGSVDQRFQNTEAARQ